MSAVRAPALHPRVETTVRDVSVRIYLHDSDDYDASCQIQLMGTRGQMHSITGAGFYLAMHEILDAARGLGLKVLCGYALAAHVRLMQQLTTRAGIEFAHGEAELIDGRPLIWVEWHL